MGKPGVAFLLSHGWHSVSDLVVRSHTIYANLRGGSTYIEKSSLYNGLDPSEKSGVSYFIGMVAAKILGARLLDTPWLFHVSMVESLGGSVVLKAKSQPDLIGLSRNRQWIVVEAKGRTWGYSAAAMTAAKQQTRQLRSVNGQSPLLRVAIQAFFNPKLEWAIEDPAEFNEDATDLHFEAEDAMEMYYSAPTIATENGHGRVIGNRKFIAQELSEIGVTIGLELNVRDRLKERNMLRPDQSSAPIQEIEPFTEGGFHVFSDGLAISLDERWTEEQMIRDSWFRRNR